MVPTCWLCGRRAQKRNNGFCLHFCLGESCPHPPPVLILMPDNLVPPSMFLAPFMLLLQHWSSEGVSQSKSMHRSFKRNCLKFQLLSILLRHNPCWFLQPEVMETSLPGTGTMGWGTWCGTGILPSQGEHLQLRYPSQFLSATHWCGTSPFHISTPPTRLNAASFYILSYRASIQIYFRWF